MKTLYVLTIVVGAILFMPSCKKENTDYRIGGVVYSANNKNKLSGVQVAVKKQVVASGTFTNSFTTAASMTTANDGGFSLTWPRENFAALQLVCSKDQYITVERDLAVTDFTTDNFIMTDVMLHPESFIRVHINNSGTSQPDDFFRYKLINAEFDCNCCDNGWKEFHGSIDTSYECRLYGDTWIKYMRQIVTTDLDTVINDSIWCPAFSTVDLDFEY
ncbi:MAG: hypothetical protein K1X54_05865 [Flavobacteriales bacterium]|nr:hypothetical protein [Flavobacteriales bacterium]